RAPAGLPPCRTPADGAARSRGSSARSPSCPAPARSPGTRGPAPGPGHAPGTPPPRARPPSRSTSTAAHRTATATPRGLWWWIPERWLRSRVKVPRSMCAAIRHRRSRRVTLCLASLGAAVACAASQGAATTASPGAVATAAPSAEAVATPGTAVTPAGKPPTVGAPGIGDPDFPFDGNGGYDVRHYTLRLSYDPATRRLAGSAIVKAKAVQDLDAFNLDLRGLRVDRVTVDGTPAGFRREGDELVIQPAARIAKGARFTVQVDYGGEPQPIREDASLGVYGFIATTDGSFVTNEPNGAKTWFPSNDHPA